MSGPYDDIIHLPHPTSPKHPRMSLHDRAAQFAPFAALSGHSAALAETARLTGRRVELDEDAKAELDLKRQILEGSIAERPWVAVTWFQPDGKKDGGAYLITEGGLKKIDPSTHKMVLTDGTEIALERVVDLQSELFLGLF